MKKMKIIVMVLVILGVLAIIVLSCSPQKAEMVKPVKIADNDYEPENWGKAYPVNYELWKKTEEPTPAGKSKYKRGFDADRITYDKLSGSSHGAPVQRLGIRDRV
jgi:nitrite reductase (cytochrome c-552)